MVTTFQTAYKYKWRKSNVYNYCVNADFGPNESKGKCSFIWWIEPPGWSNRVPNFKGVLLIFPKCGFYEMTLGFPFYTAHGLFQSIGLQSRGVIFVYIYIYLLAILNSDRSLELALLAPEKATPHEGLARSPTTIGEIAGRLKKKACTLTSTYGNAHKSIRYATMMMVT